jgi:hypothetical protein
MQGGEVGEGVGDGGVEAVGGEVDAFEGEVLDQETIGQSLRRP